MIGEYPGGDRVLVDPPVEYDPDDVPALVECAVCGVVHAEEELTPCPEPSCRECLCDDCRPTHIESHRGDA